MTEGISIWSYHRSLLGEGVIWDPRRNCIFWIDIKQARLFQTECVAPGETELTITGNLGGTIGCIATEPESDNLLAATGRGFVRLQMNGGSKVAMLEPLCDPESHLPGNRFNDGTIDPNGHFWAGSMDDSEQSTSGSWWRWDGKRAQQMATGFQVTNGPAFVHTKAGDCRVFLTDSACSTIYVARYDAARGLTGKRVWRRFNEQEGYPDGMCLDGVGRLWVAFWDGGAIRAFDPEEAIGGNPIGEFQLPVQRPTKIAFTGEGDCFVSSASIGLENRIANGLDDGRLLRLEASMFEL